MELIATILGVLCVLAISEYWWRTRKPHDELSRKFVHITVGSFAAFWPYYLSKNQILLLSAAFVLVIAISKYFRLFQAIHAVQRPTWGEVYFALAVGLLALVTVNPLTYSVALLHMSLADGLAAVVGSIFGKRGKYLVFGSSKTIVGTLAFLVVSVTLLGYYGLSEQLGVSALVLLGLTAIGATIMENLGILGTDNVIIPVFVAAMLSQV